MEEDGEYLHFGLNQHVVCNFPADTKRQMYMLGNPNLYSWYWTWDPIKDVDMPNQTFRKTILLQHWQEMSMVQAISELRPLVDILSPSHTEANHIARVAVFLARRPNTVPASTFRSSPLICRFKFKYQLNKNQRLFILSLFCFQKNAV